MIQPTSQFCRLVDTHGVSMAARILRRSYADVRDAALRAGLTIRRGRRVRNADRDWEIYRKFLNGYSTAMLAAHYGVTTERIRQVLDSKERQAQGVKPTDIMAANAVSPTPVTAAVQEEAVQA